MANETKLSDWLTELGLGDYVETFQENDIDWSIIPELTTDDLKDLGVTSIGLRRKFIKAVSELGTPAASSKAKPPATEATLAQQAERRQISVLFCDMVGSTSLSTQIDPEDMREVQRMYQDAVAAAVSKYGGHIANFIGDGIVVYFGWPLASENQALQAVRAGREALASVIELKIPGTDLTLSARAGIATGQVVVGDLAGEISHQSAAISGEAPNRAARLQELAGPGQLTIDVTTQRLLKSSFDLTELGAHQLKGLSTDIEVFRVDDERSIDSHFDAVSAAHGEKPFVGRQNDDELIKARWQRTLAGEGQVVLLSGEAGIGKSRMISHLSASIDEERATILRYQCAQNLVNAALHPVAAAIERSARFSRSDSLETKLEKLESALYPGERPIKETAALLSDVLKLPTEDRYPALGMSPQRQLEETLLALLEQTHALAERNPVLIIFEDLHWADPTTLDLLGRLMAEITARPIMLLATYRQEFSPPWPLDAHITQITLNRINTAQCADMIDQLTGGKPLNAEIKAQIIAKADGVPLFVEEITKTVLEAGYVFETDTSFEPVGGAVDLSIPSTIQDTLTARLDRHSPVKNIAQIGACIGREFAFEPLLATAEMPEPSLIEALVQLVQAEIVYQRGAPPLSTYIFKHALLRDAAYDSLLRNRKRQYHKQLFDFIEAQDRVDVNRAALHADAAGLAEKAASYYLQAGRAAMGAGTFSEAVSQLSLGLSQIPLADPSVDRDRAELDLRVSLGTAEMAMKGWAADEIITALDPAVPLAKTLEDDFALGLSLFSIWIYHATRADMVTAQQWLSEMDAVVANSDNTDLQMIADTAASMNYFWVGAFDKAEERRVRTIRDYEAPKHRHLVQYMNHDPYATVHQWGGATQLWCQGFPDQAMEAAAEALSHARTLESPFSVIFALTLGSISLIEAGQGRRMLAQCEEASAICDEIGLPFIKIVSCNSLKGRALIALGEDAEGLPTLTESTAMWEAVGGKTTYGEYTTRLATALGRLGRFDEAFESSNRALAHQAETGEIWYQPESHRIHGTLLLQAPAPNKAQGVAYLEQALTLAKAKGALSFELRAATSLARLKREAGNGLEAEQLLAPVYDQFTEGFDTPDLQAAKMLLEKVS
ncbi:MAG: AAA family ATPase [Pseudomonadota bacterium]